MFFEARTHFQSMIDHLNNLAWKIFHVKDMTLKCDRCPQDPLMLPPMPGPGLALPPPVVWNVDADLFEIVVAVPGRETQQQPASRSRD